MIRPATRDDIARVYELIHGLAEYERLLHAVEGNLEGLVADFERGAYWCFVAEVEGAVVGFALGFRTYSTFRMRSGVWLEDLFVEPTHRGAGVGKQLLNTVIAMARAEGAGRVEWSVLDWNTPAIGFYESMGATILPDWKICRVTL